MLRLAAYIALKDVRMALLERETWLWIFLMPPVFFYFIGTITGGSGMTGGSSSDPDPLVLSVPQDGGFLVDQLEHRLGERNFEVQVVEAEVPGDAPKRRLVVPPDFTERVLAGEQSTLELRRRGEGLSASFDEVRVSRAVYSLLADVVVLAGTGVALTPESLEQLSSAPRSLTLNVHPAGKRREIPSGFEQTVPGTLIMFTILVLLTSGAIPLLVERRKGILRRLASAPVARGTIVFGKWMGKMVLALVQIGFALLVGTLVFGVRWGEAFPMVCVVLFAWAAFNASLGLLVGSLARTEGQAVAIGVLGANVLAALGGCWWPIEITPGWMQRMALFLPTGWAMDAMHRLVSFGQGAGAAVPHVLGILAATLVVSWLATRWFRFQ